MRFGLRSIVLIFVICIFGLLSLAEQGCPCEKIEKSFLKVCEEENFSQECIERFLEETTSGAEFSNGSVKVKIKYGVDELVELLDSINMDSPIADIILSMIDALVGGSDEFSVRMPCDPFIEEPVTECWFEEMIPGYYDEECMYICSEGCMAVFGSKPALLSACIAGCYVSCYVPAYPDPDSLVCETVYPCR